MPIYNKGIKAESIYYHGRPIKDAYYYGDLVFHKKRGGVTTDGRNLGIGEVLPIFKRKSRYDSRTGEWEDWEVTEPIGREIVIPAAKDDWHDGDTYYTSNMVVTHNEYPEVSLYAGDFNNRYFEIQYITTKGDGTYTSTVAQSSAYHPAANYAEGGTPASYTCGYIRRSTSLADTMLFDIRFKITMRAPDKTSGDWIQPISIEYGDEDDPEHFIQGIDYNRVTTSMGTVTTPYIYLNQVRLCPGSATSNKGPIKFHFLVYGGLPAGAYFDYYGAFGPAAMDVRCRGIIVERHWDDDMIMEIMAYEDTYIYEDPETGEVVEDVMNYTDISLTPASEYNPLTGHGVANVVISESGETVVTEWA